MIKTYTLTIGAEHKSIDWRSGSPPFFSVQRAIFHLERKDIRDFEWSSRLAPASLRYACRIIEDDNPKKEGAYISMQTSFGALISPMMLQPVFDLVPYWRFQAPRKEDAFGFHRPIWHTELRLEHFSFRPSESATLLIATDAVLQGEAVGVSQS